MAKNKDSLLSAMSFLESAEGYLGAAIKLCETYKETTDPIGLLSSHALEIGLKAVLIKVGKNESDLKNLGHNLEKTWEEAAPILGLSTDIPYTLKVLSFSHNAPFHYRYPNSEFRVAIPNCDDISKELNDIMKSIRCRIETPYET